MPKIHVGDPSKLATSIPPMATDVPYESMIRSVLVAAKTDKNGNNYLQLKLEIISPEEYRGRNIDINYLCLPIPITPEIEANPYELNKANEQNLNFAQFAECFKLAYDGEEVDTDDMLGKTGQHTIKNEEYQNRQVPRVDRYLL